MENNTEKRSSEVADDYLSDLVNARLKRAQRSERMVEEITDLLSGPRSGTDAELVNDIMSIVGC